MSFVFPEASQVTSMINERTHNENAFVTADLCPINATEYLDSPSQIQYDVIGATKGFTKPGVLGEDPDFVDQRSITTKTATPLYFKEAIRINEAQLCKMRMPGSENAERSQQMIFRAVEQLNVRLNTLREVNALNALCGAITVGEQTIEYPVQTATAAVSWDQVGHDIRADLNEAVEKLQATGSTEIIMIADRSVYALLAKDEEFAGAMFGSDVARQLGAEGLARLLPDFLGMGITECRVSRQSYLNDAGNKVKFMPGDKVILIGKNGQRIMDYASVKNAYTNTAGMFGVVQDHQSDALVPHVDIVAGLYGIPVIYQPNNVVCVTVLYEEP